jgi:acetate kinase
MQTLRKLFPELIQIACFDTAFHHDLPKLARILPIPRRYERLGVRRYGFHGLSYTYLLEALKRLAGPEIANGRVILAHLGNGASLAAVSEGRCMDTSMGFTPAAGLVMGSRCGDLDPGIFAYLARTESMTADQFDELVNQQSGMLGVSEISSDMRELLAREESDLQAADAVSLFCYQAKKWIGSFAAVLGGLDAIVFSGGIGENCDSIRSRICESLSFLGVSLNQSSNSKHSTLISASGSQVAVYVIKTDEELLMVRSAITLLATLRPTATEAIRLNPGSTSGRVSDHAN